VLLHLFFAPLLWLLLRMPNATLGASLALYALVHMFGWSMPAWPNGHWAFNPLAWQLLAVLGAWMVIEGERVRPWLTSRKALVPAALYLVFSLVIALSWRIKPLEALIPQGLTKLAYPLDKSNLDPLRLLHFLALAVVAVWFVPPNRQALTTPAMRGAILCGKHSLPIFCLGVLLTLASLLALLDVSEGLAMQIMLSVGGILMMIVAATMLNLVKTTPRLQPTAALPVGVRAQPDPGAPLTGAPWRHFAEDCASSDGPAARIPSSIAGSRIGKPTGCFASQTMRHRRTARWRTPENRCLVPLTASLN
jgi:hypothetical protein